MSPNSATQFEHRGAQVSLWIVTDPPGRLVTPGLPMPRVSMHLGRSVYMKCQRAGLTHRGWGVQGDIDVVPAYTPCVWEADAPDTALIVSVHPDLLTRTAYAQPHYRFPSSHHPRLHREPLEPGRFSRRHCASRGPGCLALEGDVPRSHGYAGASIRDPAPRGNGRRSARPPRIFGGRGRPQDRLCSPQSPGQTDAPRAGLLPQGNPPAASGLNTIGLGSAREDSNRRYTAEFFLHSSPSVS